MAGGKVSGAGERGAGLAGTEASGTELSGTIVSVLPPREGFSPGSVGAIGLLVHRLGRQDDVVVGQATGALTFSGRRFVPAETPVWPLLGRVDRYMAGAVRSVQRLAPRLIEVHNRARLAVRLARACPQARVVLFVHNDPQAMRGARLPAERRALLGLMTVVCVSHWLAERFSDGLAAGAPAPEILENTLDFTEVPPLLPPERRDRTILFVGRVVANKGTDAFVASCADALPLLPGWSACIIGADRFAPGGKPTAFERALHPSARAAGVAMLGYLPHAEVMQAMARAAILVVPSRWTEPFGMTALEGAACGAALVCSMRGGLRRVVGEAALVADPDAPGALAAAIVRLAGDAALRAQLSAAGLERARLFDARDARVRLAQLRARLLRT